MARVNIDILGISELKWTGMGEFNSDDHCIYYCGKESLRRNGVAQQSTNESEMQFSSVQPLSRVRLFATPWTAARHASLSITNSQSLLKFMSIESVMPSNHLILCHSLLIPSKTQCLGPRNATCTSYFTDMKQHIHKITSVQFSCSVVSNSLQSHGLQHARPPCPSPTLRVYSNSCPLGR